MGSYTPLKNYYKPSTGEAGWGALVNATFDALDNEPDWGGIIKVHASGGVSMTSGAHVDPGADIFDVFYTISTGLLQVDTIEVATHRELNGWLDVTGDLEHSGTNPAEFLSGILTEYSGANVTNPPTAAELNSAFGAPAEGFVALLDDALGDTDVWLIAASDISYFYLKLTKAT